MKAIDTRTVESRLVLRVQLGDRAALDDLLRRTQTWLHRYLMRLLRDRHAADEALQETFLRIFRSLAYLREPRAYRAWAYRIASREAFAHLRRESKRLRAQEAATERLLDADTAAALDPELVVRLEAHVGNLPPNTRAVVVLHYLEQMTIRQVAEVLGIASGTAKSRLAYGLTKLRETLDPETNR